MLLPVVAVMSLTRPSGLAFALAMLLHAIHRWVTRGRDPFPVRERVAVIVVGLWSFLCGIGWLLIAWAVTGSLTAYLDTELAWRRPYIGDKELVPFTPWCEGAGFWQQFLPLPARLRHPGAGRRRIRGIPVQPLDAAARPRPAVLDRELRALSARRVLPAVEHVPAAHAAVPGARRGRRRCALPAVRALIVFACIVGQWGWVQIGWWVAGYDWTPP